jgi:sugar (pentulose or hexulose) kinase
MGTGNVLAFDLGGSGGKLIKGAFDGKRLELSRVCKFENRPLLIRDALYWDITGIYRHLAEGLKKASAEYAVLSLGIDSFSNDFGFIDRNGELLSQVRCYRDRRTVKYADYVYSRVSPRRLYELTGNQNAPFNTLMQIGAMQAAGQGWLLERADKLLLAPDLLLYFLTGDIRAEYTIASVSQLFNFFRTDFDEEILGSFNLPRERFGPVVQPGTSAGRVVIEGEKYPFNAVSVCGHDTASAYCASPFNGKDTLIISSGTWSLLGCEIEKPLICEEGYRWNFANEGGYPGHHRFLRNVMGSWIIQEIRADYLSRGQDISYGEMEKAAEAAVPFAFFIDVDDDLFFHPGDMAEKVKSYCRKHYGKAPEELGSLICCVYESLAMKYRRNLDLLKAITGRTIKRINVLGGGSKDSLMCGFTAGACSLPVLAGPEEATALGSILVQLIAAGELSTLEEGRSVIASSFPPVCYEPQNAAHWEEEYRRYDELFPLQNGM